jgi:hypothetical protein
MTFVIPRSVDACQVERMIFNFRIKTEALEKILPLRWLKPQVFSGWNIVSYCILTLDQYMEPLMLGIWGYKTTSYAFRCGAMDKSMNQTSQSVYMTERHTDLSLSMRFALNKTLFFQFISIKYGLYIYVINQEQNIKA